MSAGELQTLVVPEVKESECASNTKYACDQYRERLAHLSNLRAFRPVQHASLLSPSFINGCFLLRSRYQARLTTDSDLLVVRTNIQSTLVLGVLDIIQHCW